MSKKPYDTKEGIRGYLSDLDGLNRLLKDRHEAWYDREEPMGQFFVLGSWRLDTCGNFMKIVEGAPRDELKPCPDVMTEEEGFELLETVLGKGNARVSSSMGSDLPLSNSSCPVCERGWTIRDCHNLEVSFENHVRVPLAEWTGRPLSEAVEFINSRAGKRWRVRLNGEEGIRNDRYIDLSPVPGYETLKQNQNGWMKERTPDDYVIQEGDDVGAAVWTYYHPACMKAREQREEFDFFRSALDEAGMRDAGMSAVPNEYHSRGAPWFEVDHPVAGRMKVGWRKRVVNLEWDEGLRLEHLFEQEESTKGRNFVHAWGKEKLVSYLSRILQEMKSRPAI